MHRYQFLIILFLTPLLWRGVAGDVYAQINLVPNPSFELYDTCPTSVSQLERANFWINPTSSSPDYYNSCAIDGVDTLCDAPRNLVGFQAPRSGNAYAGFAAFSNCFGCNVREYIEVKLQDSLVKDKKYIVSFYLALANCQFATNEIGAYFSNALVDTLTNNWLPYHQQIRNRTGNVLSDTTNWMNVTDTIVAQGGEQFLTIGTFVPDSAITIDTVASFAWFMAYYYIDDVSVIEDTSTVGVNEIHLAHQDAKVFPNPFSENFTIEISPCANALFELYDVFGRRIFSKEIKSKELLKPDIPSGIYFYKVKDERGTEIGFGKVLKE